jgi:P27 family predicted phage terminase small subunit
MPSGRRPKPTIIKILNGNPGKRPLNDAEPEVVAHIPDVPYHLDDVATAEWQRVTAELHAMGMLGDIDRAALAAYCVAWSRWVQAEQQIADEGYVLTGREGGTYQNPMLAVANKAMEQMCKYAVEFGMTPSSRTRIKVSPNAEKTKSSILEFLNQRKSS